MTKISKAIKKIQDLTESQQKETWLNKINPVAKLTVTIFYLIITVSFKKNQILPLCSMAIYPVIIFLSANISLRKALQQLNFIFPVILIMGILNPIFDRTPIASFVFSFGKICITGGMISSLSLIIKGICTVFASYILISSTTIEKICGALKKLHFPDIIIIQLMLTFRYLIVLLEQAEKIIQAYRLRAPGQKGIHYKAWGSLVGNLLLQSFGRAQEIYESMCLRGFSGKYFLYNKLKFTFKDFMFMMISICAFFIFRFFPVFEFVGKIISKVFGEFL